MKRVTVTVRQDPNPNVRIYSTRARADLLSILSKIKMGHNACILQLWQDEGERSIAVEKKSSALWTDVEGFVFNAFMEEISQGGASMQMLDVERR